MHVQVCYHIELLAQLEETGVILSFSGGNKYKEKKHASAVAHARTQLSLCVELRMTTSLQSGYQCDFADSVGDYECPLCLHVTREPSLTSCCGQHFCQACINSLLVVRTPCPLCKSADYSVFLDKKQKRRVLSLTVHCSNKACGCEWMKSLSELEGHLSAANGDCLFVRVSCNNGCGESLERRYMEDHCTKSCPKRPYHCQYCDFYATYDVVCNKHIRTCKKYPVPCPNGCRDVSLVKGQLKKHISECPIEVLECDFKELGCNEKIPRKDLVKHMEDNMRSHLTLVSKQSLQTSVRLKETQGQLRAVQQQLSKAERNLKDKQYQIDNLASHVNEMAVLSPIQFTFSGYRLWTSRGSGVHWTNGPIFCTRPLRYELRVSLGFYTDQFLFNLVPILSGRGGDLPWPIQCTVTFTVFNQAFNKDHLEIKKNIVINRGYGDNVCCILYRGIEAPPNQVQFLNNDCLCFGVRVDLR